MYDPLRNRYRFTCPVESAAHDRPLSAFGDDRAPARSRAPGGVPRALRLRGLRRRASGRCCRSPTWTAARSHRPDRPPVRQRADRQVGAAGRRDHRRRRAAPASRQLAVDVLLRVRARVAPGYPSHLARLSPAEDARSVVGVAVRCACLRRPLDQPGSQRHLDEPFYHDRVLRSRRSPAAARRHVPGALQPGVVGQRLRTKNETATPASTDRWPIWCQAPERPQRHGFRARPRASTARKRGERFASPRRRCGGSDRRRFARSPSRPPGRVRPRRPGRP